MALFNTTIFDTPVDSNVYTYNKIAITNIDSSSLLSDGDVIEHDGLTWSFVSVDETHYLVRRKLL